MTRGQEAATKVEALLNQLGEELQYYDDDRIWVLFETFSVELLCRTAEIEIYERQPHE